MPLDELDAIVAAVRKAQSAHYRNIAAMDRDEKIRCGAYVYFSFLRPFAEAAGIADELDWTVPRDIPPPLYEFVSMLEGDNTASSMDGAVLRLDPVTTPDDPSSTKAGTNRVESNGRSDGRSSRGTPDATFGAMAAITLLPASRHAWYWAAVVRESHPLLTLVDTDLRHAVDLARLAR